MDQYSPCLSAFIRIHPRLLSFGRDTALSAQIGVYRPPEMALAACGETRPLTVAALQRTESAEPRTLVSGLWDFYHGLLAQRRPGLR
jgi:hypothetical protein